MKRDWREIVARTSACAVWFLWQVSVGWKRIHTWVSIIKQTRGVSAAHCLTCINANAHTHVRGTHTLFQSSGGWTMRLTRGPRRERQIGNEGWWMVLMGLYLRDCRGMWRGEAGRDGEHVWNTLHPNSALSVCFKGTSRSVCVGELCWLLFGSGEH